MQRPDLNTVPSFYKNYVTHVKDFTMMEAQREGHKQLIDLLKTIPEEKGAFRYQPEKWSIKEMINHMMDAERIFCYRALRFGRNDKTELRGFDEKAYAPEANAHARTLAQLIEEVKHLRASTLDLFSSFTPDMLERTGNANKTEVSVLHIGYIIPGHELHHCTILKERYLLS